MLNLVDKDEVTLSYRTVTMMMKMLTQTREKGENSCFSQM